MKKYCFIITLLIMSVNLFSQSTYSGNLSVSDDNFFKEYRDKSEFYVGGCNAFPIGTFVNVKLPYSDESVDVKIVKRIPEDGIFILIDKLAGEKLYLETDDVLPVRIQVINYTPPPIETMDEETDPEPKIKGLSALALNDEIVPEDVKESEIVSTEIVSTEVEEDDFKIIEEPLVEEEVVTSDELLDPEIVIVEDNEEEDLPAEMLLEESTDKLLDETVADDTVVDEAVETPVIDKIDNSEELVTDREEIPADNITTTITEIPTEIEKKEEVLEEEKPLVIYEDELPVDSMFTDDIVLEKTPESSDLKAEVITEIPEKSIKRIFYLEPANNKPPIGGVEDKTLVPVTTVDKTRVLEDGYYLQVGIYTKPENIKLDSEKLKKINYPYIKVKEEGTLGRERLLVGPLSNDELGVIMINLKSRGFKDFFRYKKKTDN